MDALEATGCERVFQDVASGAKTSKPGLDDALSYIRPGDSLVVWRLDRLGRSLPHLIHTVTMLEEREVGFQSLQESIEPSTSGGKLIFYMFGALAEFERNLIRERTEARLRAARSRGRKGGRPKTLNEKKTQLQYKLYDERQHSISELCDMMGISKIAIWIPKT